MGISEEIRIAADKCDTTNTVELNYIHLFWAFGFGEWLSTMWSVQVVSHTQLNNYLIIARYHTVSSYADITRRR